MYGLASSDDTVNPAPTYLPPHEEAEISTVESSWDNWVKEQFDPKVLVRNVVLLLVLVAYVLQWRDDEAANEARE